MIGNPAEVPTDGFPVGRILGFLFRQWRRMSARHVQRRFRRNRHSGRLKRPMPADGVDHHIRQADDTATVDEIQAVDIGNKVETVTTAGPSIRRRIERDRSAHQDRQRHLFRLRQKVKATAALRRQRQQQVHRVCK